MILAKHFHLFSNLLFLFILIRDANGLYVPRVYGRVDPQKFLFITETGEQHQIYRIGNVFMFGRVYVLDAQNANLLKANGNHRHLCPEMEKLENTLIRPNLIIFRHTHQHRRISTELVISVGREDDGICRIKSEDHNLEYPIYSCQTINMNSAQERQDACPPEHYFYLEETMDKENTMPKLITFKLTNDEIIFCGQIESIGLSIFVREKTWMETLQFWKKQRETINPHIREETLLLDLRQHVNNVANTRQNRLYYQGVFIIINRLQCNDIKMNAKNSVSPELKNTAFQMKLICEDMKSMLVQITKGNLQNRQLNFNDLNAKLEKTVEILKKQYRKAFGAESGESEKMENLSFADVLKQLAIYTIKADFLRSKLKDQQAMKKRLKEFAGTLLYSLESIQKYYSQNLPLEIFAKLFGGMSVLLIISFFMGGIKFGFVMTAICGAVLYSGVFFGESRQKAIYRALLVEEIYKPQTDKVAIVGNTLLPSIAAKHTKNEKEQCTICLGEFADSDVIKRVPACNHIFHSGCFDIWAMVHFTCPLCRRNVLNVKDKP